MKKMMLLPAIIGGWATGSAIYRTIRGGEVTWQIPLLLFAILLALIVIGNKLELETDARRTGPGDAGGEDDRVRQSDRKV